MKRLSIIALLVVAPLATKAQPFIVFSDTFNNGSTLNHTSVPGGTPFASFTSYDIASTKPDNTAPQISGGKFILTLNGSTTSGMNEAQALFTPSPVSLQTVGDFVNLTYTFISTNLLAGGTGSYIWTGLYNSDGGTPPVAGALNNSGLNTAANSSFATGNCQLWQGYVSRISSNGTSQAYTRPAQNGGYTSSANQDLVGAGVSSGNYTNPPAVVFDVNETVPVALANAQVYTISYTIALSAAGQITVTNALYSGAGTGGTLIFSQTNTATGANVLTTSFDGMAIGLRNNGTSFNPSMSITNLVISESISGLPGQPFDVTGGGTGCTGISSFPVGLDGSVANNDYYLYTNGIWTGIVSNGTGSAINFGLQAVQTVPLTNTIIASNTVNTFTGSMLGSAIVAPNSPPSITNQPSPVLVANGSIGVFSVGASGGDLSYQWYKNSLSNPLSNGGNISGATNATLIISPAGAGDAASYFVVVTSGCNVSDQSSSVSLTIDAAANLTWTGNNPNSNWDLTITPNFSGSLFHNGDNVTFGDGASTFTVDVTGNFIAPGVITENSSLAYTFNGPGVIQGPGRLAMSGTGTLTINNSNAYTGGTTISSGTVSLNNGSFSSAGTGTITLAGGTLDIPLKAGSGAGLSNNINVTASSTLQYDQNATFACVLDGQLTGSSSATLTIFASDPNQGTARVRLYSPFTNNANVILQASATLSGSDIELAPYLGSDNQVFNGVISGTGGHIVPRGNGNVILNNSGNTFNDTTTVVTPNNISLLMSSGNVGIGADSVQSTPPTIDSSPVGVGLMAVNVGAEGGTCSFFASGGSHTIANQFIYTSATNTVTVRFGGTNNLTFSGEFDLANPNNGSPSTLPTDSNGTNRTLDVTNTAATTFSGVITDNGNTSGFTKTGGGSLYLNGTNIYAGPTTNNGGVLAGSGSIAGPVIVGTNGSIGGGSAASIGTLTISNNLTVNGNVFVRVNKSLAQSNDVISVTGSLANTGTGTVDVNNLGSALVVGDKFQIFNKLVSGGSALTITGGGAGVQWTNNLGVDGSISVLSISGSGPTTNANITRVFLSGTNVVVVGTNNNIPNTSFHYAVITSTNIITPLSNWTVMGTNPFNPDGTFDYTNPIVPGTPRQFIDVLAVP